MAWPLRLHTAKTGRQSRTKEIFGPVTDLGTRKQNCTHNPKPLIYLLFCLRAIRTALERFANAHPVGLCHGQYRLTKSSSINVFAGA
jgi:hypothetical protein